MINYTYLFILLNIIIFILGYILGKYSQFPMDNNLVSFLSQNKKVNQPSLRCNIDIDERKIVTRINTDGLEKKYESLGQKQVSDNDINESINKLKNLKRS